MSEADDLNGAIDRSKRGLNRMLQSSTELTLTLRGATAQWSIEFLDPECEGRYHNEMLGLGYMIDAVRVYAGRDWAPDLVLVTSSRGTPKGRLEQILDAGVSTGHAVPAIRFDARLLSNRAARVAQAGHSGGAAGLEPPVPKRPMTSPPFKRSPRWRCVIPIRGSIGSQPSSASRAARCSGG